MSANSSFEVLASHRRTTSSLAARLWSIGQVRSSVLSYCTVQTLRALVRADKQHFQEAVRYLWAGRTPGDNVYSALQTRLKAVRSIVSGIVGWLRRRPSWGTVLT